MTPVTRHGHFAFILALWSSTLTAQGVDPVFSQIPFDRWLSQKNESPIRFTAHLTAPRLSSHQRLAASVEVQVDGAELASRRGKGEFFVLAQVSDDKGRTWQNHQEMDLTNMEEGMKANNVEFSQFFFVLPGDYDVSVAVYDDATGEHGVLKRRLHVPPLKNDPLPDAWRSLPAVEFIPDLKPPERWILSSIRGKPDLAVSTHEPVHVDLLVNLTPSEWLAGSAHIQNRNFDALLPAAKVLAQVDWGGANSGAAACGIKLLDLAKQRVVYRQDDVHGLDWAGLGTALTQANPGTIDAHSLEKRRYSAEFFMDEVRRTIRAARALRPHRPFVLIVLSSVVHFSEDQELLPIKLIGAGPARVFYIRYKALPGLSFGAGRPPRATGPDFGVVDQLEPLLKPLDPRLFEVTTPEQFRRAFAAIFSEVAKL